MAFLIKKWPWPFTLTEMCAMDQLKGGVMELYITSSCGSEIFCATACM